MVKRITNHKADRQPEICMCSISRFAVTATATTTNYAIAIIRCRCRCRMLLPSERINENALYAVHYAVKLFLCTWHM